LRVGGGEVRVREGREARPIKEGKIDPYKAGRLGKKPSTRSRGDLEREKKRNRGESHLYLKSPTCPKGSKIKSRGNKSR